MMVIKFKIMMKKTFLFLAVFFLSWTCAEQKSAHVEIYGISFDCPSGWKVSETKDKGFIKHISIEKKGISTSGLVTMFITEEDVDVEILLQNMEQSFKEKKSYKNPVFQQAEESRYGKYKCISSSYTFMIASLKHEGQFYIISENGTTIGLIHQEAVEDHKVNLHGFETIKESFSLSNQSNEFEQNDL
jgi:hypothetical protein